MDNFKQLCSESDEIIEVLIPETEKRFQEALQNQEEQIMASALRDMKRHVNRLGQINRQLKKEIGK